MAARRAGACGQNSCVPAPLPESVRQQVRDLLPSGKSCRKIAQEAGISPASVSKIAREVGHRFEQQHAAHAREVRSAYCAAARADFAARLFGDLERLRGQLFAETVQFSFGGRDNDYAEHTTDRPTVQQQRDLMVAISNGVKSLLDIDRHDRQTDDVSVFGQWLASLKDGPSGS